MLGKPLSNYAAAVLTLCALLGSACASSPEEHGQPMAESVTLKNQWVSSAQTGMAAVFGTFANTGHHEARIVAGNSPLAGRVEVREVVPDAAGNNSMRPKEGGLTVPSGGTRELIPGGDHLMLMNLKQPLHPGADVSLTVVFDDGSTLPVTAEVRDFTGANEAPAPGGDGPNGAPITMAKQPAEHGLTVNRRHLLTRGSADTAQPDDHETQPS
jgi:periplasmic copper chaperone A